jgi:OPA family glycerol-3-phosphate transporter-like MFS transporter
MRILPAVLTRWLRWLAPVTLVLLCASGVALAADGAAAAGAAGSGAPAHAAAKAPPPIYEEGLPILILIAVIALVVVRMPKIDVGHSKKFVHRRLLNGLPLGLTYAFLYMGRYNIGVFKDSGGLSGHDFGNIDTIGSIVYGVSFLLNGPLTDRWGGRVTILIAAGGTLAVNAVIGFLMLGGTPVSVTMFSILFAANMYFQSFGAVSIVKVNASWFHLRERGTFGGIFGILISLGLYFAYDWGYRIVRIADPAWLFLTPALILALFWVLSYLFVRDTPADAGLADFDVADASSADPIDESPWQVIKRMMSNKIILTIAIIELCSGFLRQGILKWYRDFAKGVGAGASYVYEHWGMVSCIAGITGGVFAGLISDHLFSSRRGPVSTVLYGLMLAGAIAIIPLLAFPASVSWVVAFMAMSIIGVHGMLSGVASQDFGGRKHAGVAVGLIDGFVYLGTAMQGQVYGGTLSLLPEKGTPASHDASNWVAWPLAMIPMAMIGMVLALRLWNARVAKAAAH